MADLTEEDYDVLDEYYTKNLPTVDPAKKGPAFLPGAKRRPVP
jgi:hypothetical protein